MSEAAETTEIKQTTALWKRPGFGRNLGAAAAILVALCGWMIWRAMGEVSTDDAQVDGHVAPVAAKIYGNVTEVLVADNQPVKAGQTLARIDARDYEVKVAQAKAAVALAEAQAKAAGVTVPMSASTTLSGEQGAAAGVQMAEADVSRAHQAYQQVGEHEMAAAQAAVAARQAVNDKAQADLGRMTPLAAKREISQQQFDAYKAQAGVSINELRAAQEKLAATQKQAEQQKSVWLAAQARLNQSRSQLTAARANRQQVAVQSAQAEAARAAVEQARANLANAELQLSYTEIKAPMDGVVTRKTVEVGQIVQPGQALMMLTPLNEIWVTANFKETQLRRVRAGQRARVKIDMYGRSFVGHVDSLAGATGSRLSLLPPENATGNFVKVVQRIPVKIVIDGAPADAVLRPGMNVDATIETR